MRHHDPSPVVVRSSWLRLLARLIPLALVAAACGSSSGDDVSDDDQESGRGKPGNASNDQEGGGGGGGGGDFGSEGSDAGDGELVGDPTSCADAQKYRTYVGCDYWPTIVPNIVWSIFDYGVVVANTQKTVAEVTVTGPNGTHQTVTVAPDSLETIYLPWVKSLKGGDMDCSSGAPKDGATTTLAKASAYHLVSSVPVTVYQFSAVEYTKGKGGPPGKNWGSCPGDTLCGLAIGGCNSYTNDASLLLPSTAMTGNYRTSGYPSSATRGCP